VSAWKPWVPRPPGAGSPRRPSYVRKGAARVREVMPASAAIASALKVHGIADEVRAERLVTEWTELVGSKIAQRTRAHGIQERTLIIEVATSAWMHELNMLKPRLLAGLRERLGNPPLFDEIRFRLAGASKKAPTVVPAPRPRYVTIAPSRAPATGAAREQIVREVEAVDDPDLRELIARVRITNDR